MSKKMLKRSLALGALMAFVITGSAMAEKAPINESKTGTGTLTIIGEVGTGNAIYSGQEDNAVKIDGYTSIKLDGNWASSDNSADVDRNIFFAEKGGVLTIGSKEALIDIIDTTNFSFNENGWGSIVFHADGAEMNIYADEIKLANFTNGIYLQDTAKMNITANSMIFVKNTGINSVIGIGSYSGDKGVSNLSIKTNELKIYSPEATAINVSEGNYGGAVGEKVKGNIDIEARTIDITAATGVNVYKGASVTDKAGVNLNVDTIKITASTAGIKTETNAMVNVTANNVEVNATNVGIAAKSNSNVNINAVNNVDVNLYDGNKDIIYGLFSSGNSAKINISAAALNISNKDSYNKRYMGIQAQSNSEVMMDENTITRIYFTDDEGNALANSGAIVAFSGAKIDLDGNLYATAEAVVDTRGNSLVEINKNGGSTVVLNGDIIYESATSTGLDSCVKINLDKSESVLNGNIYAMTKDGILDNPMNTIITGTTLNISNGAKWTTDGNSFVNNLNLTDGVVEMEGEGEQKVLVGTVNGEGTIITTNVNNNMNIANDSADELTVRAAGELANEIAGMSEAAQKEALQNLTNVVTTGTGNSAKTVADKVGTTQGAVAGAITADVVTENDAETGETVIKVTNVSEGVHTGNQAIGEAAVALKTHWRAHMNDMNKRMGELRNANGEHGVWTRMVRGESEFDGAKMQYNQYQLGYDEKLSVDKRWTVGAAVTFSEGNSNYSTGSAEDDSTAFAIYGSKLNNDGTFVDLIARYANVESDLDDVNAGKGDYSAHGYSVSAEFGKRIQQGNGLWIEPQVELTYGSLDSADFTFSKNGNKVHVGDIDSLIGRVGFSLGKDIKEGNVYARASYLYDFDGETETTYTNGITRSIKEDLGGGWWEVGVGANINLSKATYIYADVEKTFGGKVDTNWQWNLGVRYSF